MHSVQSFFFFFFFFLGGGGGGGGGGVEQGRECRGLHVSEDNKVGGSAGRNTEAMDFIFWIS